MSNPDGGPHCTFDKSFGSDAGNRCGTKQLLKTFTDFCRFAGSSETVFEWPVVYPKRVMTLVKLLYSEI